MPRKKYSELTAGLFVLAAFGTLMGIVLWLGASDIFKKARQHAVFYVDETTGPVGLAVGNPVQITDQVIGKINRMDVDFQTGRTLYFADIETPGVDIHADGKARASVGLVGTGKLVVLSRGSKDKPLADEKNPVEITGGLEQAMANITTVSENLKTIAQTVQHELDASQSATMLAKIHVVMDDLKKAAANITGISQNVLHETDAQAKGSLLAKFHASTDDLNAITADAKPKLARTLTAVENTATAIEGYTKKDIVEILASLREVSAKLLKIGSDFGEVSEQAKIIMVVNRDRIDEIVDNLAQVSDNLKATSKEVRRSPWRLLYKPDEKELKSQNIYDAARAFSTGASQLEQAVGKLSALSKAYPNGIPANDPQLEKVRKEIQDTFGNFNKAEKALWDELLK